FATSAAFADAVALVLDSSGGLLISDYQDSRVRRIAPNQSIATVAGGEYGFSGDGGPATSAKLFLPQGIATDSKGAFYLVDSHRVRKVAPDGTITTVAGNGRNGFSGDGGLATQASFNTPFGIAVDAAGNIFIADP